MFETALKAAQNDVRLALAQTLADQSGTIAEAMLYATSGGKALRGFLVLESANLFDFPREKALPAAAAIEAMHAYSLIHDDLPCMDDDDLRRGQPTVHRKWDEATAVLAGDALQTLAFSLLATPIVGPSDRRIALISSLATASGHLGMVGGQALDIAAETADAPLTLPQITTLQAGKTGALITWSASAGAMLADQDTAPLIAYGDAIGLAFQIADDVLDIEGTAADMGKAVGKDVAAGKATFLSILGLDGAKSRANELVTLACDALSCYGSRADTLRQAAHFVISRKA